MGNFMRNSEDAFNNAIQSGKMTNPDDYMYMHSKTYKEDGPTYDVFKHVETRHHETVEVEPSKPIVDDFIKAIDMRKLNKLNKKELTDLSNMLDKIND
jgi:hypothetical protein